MNLPLFDTPKKFEDHFNPQADIVLYQGDVSDFITTVPGNSVSLIITSPPYNLGKEYEDRVSIGKYLDT